MRIEPSQCRVRQRLGRVASKKPARALQDLAETPGVEIRTKHKGSGRERLHRFRQNAARATFTHNATRDPLGRRHGNAYRPAVEFWNGLQIVISILF
jgi:hypothetical protein